MYDAVAPAAAALPLTGGQGVTVEVYDVSAERASLRLRPRPDLRAIAGFVASAGLHAAAALAVLAVLTHRDSETINADEMNERGAIVRDTLTRIAANENAPDNPREDRAPAAVDAVGTPEPPEQSAAAEVVAHGAAGHDTVSTAPSVCTPPKTGASRGPRCQRNVVVTSLTKRPSCFVDTVVQNGQEGTLAFPCDGDGEATLTFGNKSFKGADVGGKIDVCTGTEYPFSDGCTWTSAQHVSGSIASGKLQFTYGEAPKPGQSQCAMACESTATVRIEGTSWRRTAR